VKPTGASTKNTFTVHVPMTFTFEAAERQSFLNSRQRRRSHELTMPYLKRSPELIDGVSKSKVTNMHLSLTSLKHTK